MSALWFGCAHRRFVDGMDITASTVFIPGATSGIGLALARRFRDAGSTVVIGGRRTDLLASLHESDGFDTVVIDVADPASITAAASAVLTRHPSLDALITMSGVMYGEDLTDPAHITSAVATIDTNLLGTIRLIDAFLPHLLTRPSATLMTVTSGLAFTPLPMTPTYNATKAAIHSYTLSLRAQLAAVAAGSAGASGAAGTSGSAGSAGSSGSSLEVLELAPPAVKTDLGGGGDFGQMPLDDFADEVVALLRAGEGPEILVQNVMPLRWSERNGNQADLIAMLGALPIH
jgi:uncharacterized oxidoreductase